MKELEEIYQEMLDCFAQRTGLEAAESCDLAVRFYAVAAQVYALYAQADWVLRQCFPQTAAGSCLDSHAQLRGLSRKEATAAEGSIRFSVARAADTDRPIPAGTVCMTAGMVRFETAQAAVLEAGASWVDVPARALMPGSAGNVPAGAVTAMAAAPVGIAACTNPAPFAGGGDEEGDEGLRQRVLSTFRRLPNGANAAFYEQGALSFDQVAAASVLPRSRGRGTVDVVAATLEGMPDEELLGQLTDYFQQRREIAVDVLVRAPEAVTVDVAVKIDGGADQAGAGERVKTGPAGVVHRRAAGAGCPAGPAGSLIFGCGGRGKLRPDSASRGPGRRARPASGAGTLTVEAMNELREISEGSCWPPGGL